MQGGGPGGAGGAHAAGHVPASGHLPDLQRHWRAIHTVRHMPRRRPRAVSGLHGWVCSWGLARPRCWTQSLALWVTASAQPHPAALVPAHICAGAASASRCACRPAWTRAAGCVCAARVMLGGGECGAADMAEYALLESLHSLPRRGGAIRVACALSCALWGRTALLCKPILMPLPLLCCSQGEPGDLYVFISTKPHPELRREGVTIHSGAALGAAAGACLPTSAGDPCHCTAWC